MLVIRLQRTGKRNDSTYRVVIAEKSAAVKGGYLALLGYYLPTREPEVFKCDTAKVQEWVKKGAQPSNTLARLLKKHGLKDMDSFITRYTKQRKKKAPPEGETPAADVTTTQDKPEQQAAQAEESSAPQKQSPTPEEKPAPTETEEEVEKEE